VYVRSNNQSTTAAPSERSNNGGKPARNHGRPRDGNRHRREHLLQHLPDLGGLHHRSDGAHRRPLRKIKDATNDVKNADGWGIGAYWDVTKELMVYGLGNSLSNDPARGSVRRARPPDQDLHDGGRRQRAADPRGRGRDGVQVLRARREHNLVQPGGNPQWTFEPNRRTALKAGAALAASTALPAWAQAKPAIRFAAVFSEKDIRAEMIRMFAKEIEADFALEPFYNGTLFKQGTELVALQRDNLEMGNIAPQDFSKQISSWSILTSAYLFRDANHLGRFWASDLGSQFKKQAEEHGGRQGSFPRVPPARRDTIALRPGPACGLKRRSRRKVQSAREAVGTGG